MSQLERTFIDALGDFKCSTTFPALQFANDNLPERSYLGTGEPRRRRCTPMAGCQPRWCVTYAVAPRRQRNRAVDRPLRRRKGRGNLAPSASVRSHFFLPPRCLDRSAWLYAAAILSLARSFFASVAAWLAACLAATIGMDRYSLVRGEEEESTYVRTHNKLEMNAAAAAALAIAAQQDRRRAALCPCHGGVNQGLTHERLD